MYERGEGSLKISQRLGSSRNTVRKYQVLLDRVQPIVLRVKRASSLDPYEEVDKSLFVDCRGHCPNLQRRLKEQQGWEVKLRTLQKFCQPGAKPCSNRRNVPDFLRSDPVMKCRLILVLKTSRSRTENSHLHFCGGPELLPSFIRQGLPG